VQQVAELGEVGVADADAEQRGATAGEVLGDEALQGRGAVGAELGKGPVRLSMGGISLMIITDKSLLLQIQKSRNPLIQKSKKSKKPKKSKKSI
jgi:hypothetical protein